MAKVDPIRDTDDEARAMARALMAGTLHASLGTIVADDGGPMVTKAAVMADGADMLLLGSDLSAHAVNLAADPRASLLLSGEAPDKGDPMTHPRLTLICRAEEADKAALRDAWLERHPKARLYYDFTDFRLLRLVTRSALLNGGFGRAYRLTRADLTPPDTA